MPQRARAHKVGSSARARRAGVGPLDYLRIRIGECEPGGKAGGWTEVRMRPLVSLCAAISLSSLLVSPARGQLITFGDGTFVFEAGLGAGPVDTEADGSFAVAVGFWDEHHDLDSAVWLFDGLVLSTADLGKTFVATAA